jgi:hypothetical protein
LKMKMKIMLGSIALAAFMPIVATAGSDSGTLVSNPAVNSGFDFYYPTALSKPLNALQVGSPVKLQARFVWDGPAGQAVTTAQHALVAFTQKGAANNWVNASGQLLWTHGAGAFVSERGLAMELWFRNDPGGNGVQDDPGDSYFWDQTNGRCAYIVSVGPTNGLCLASTPSPGGHITPASFTLKKGVAYWVRVSLEREASNPAWAVMRANLVEETSGGAVVVQTGSVGFMVASFFPYSGQAMEASIARTPGPAGEAITHFVAFDHGF